MNEIDLDFSYLGRSQLIQRYTSIMRQLRIIAEENYGVRPLLFDNYVLRQYFYQQTNNSRTTNLANDRLGLAINTQRTAGSIRGSSGNGVSGGGIGIGESSSSSSYLKLEMFNIFLDRRRQIICWFFYLALLSLCVVAYRYDAAAGANERVVQTFSYPSMRIWRRMTMPIIQRFPQLTELYDESCLMGNPFFQIEDLSCRPCANVESVWMESDECAERETTSTTAAAAAVTVAATAAAAVKTSRIFNVNTKVNENGNGNANNNGNSNGINSAKDQGNNDLCQLPAENVPFVFKNKQQQPIELVDFYHIYANNHKIFQRDAYRVHSTHQDIHNLEDLFGQFNNSVVSSKESNENDLKKNKKTDSSSTTTTTTTSSTSTTSSSNNNNNNNNNNNSRNKKNKSMANTNTNTNILSTQRKPKQTHNLWRCNRMLPARLLRPIFARPTRLPSMSVALERYIAIDTPQAPAYTLPETECANVYVHQAVGTRFIILRPTSECRQHCRTLSMRLTQSSVLSYNWLYWKPISAPDPLSETLSISLIGSYC